jgi:uncharacterized RDD family membrane protein YckC
MKCPKCGYIGFEDVDRCRNCGYDFSLTLPQPEPDLTIRRESEAMNPLDDLSLIDAASVRARTDRSPDLNKMIGVTDALGGRAVKAELPLFGTAVLHDDAPLITKASAPRPPLAVRRATPEVPRLRDDQQRLQSSFDLTIDHEPDDDDAAIFTPAARATRSRWPADRPERPQNAAVAARLAAVIIDLLILGAIDVVVIYFTMQICGLTVDDLGILPKGPMLAFLLVQNGGYLVTFTAGGQTLGKMATGIRVVATESAGTLDLGRAIARTLVWMLLAVPAGLGFLTLFSRDHRGLHDRFAGTRVVRASA